MTGPPAGVPGPVRPSRGTVLIVEDDPVIRFALRDFLTSHGIEALEADSCAAGERMVAETLPDAIVLDYQLPDGNALDLLSRLREGAIAAPSLVLTAHGSIELAVRAIQLGAHQFLTKPVELPALLTVLDRMIEQSRVLRRQAADRSPRGRLEPDPFLGKSPGILRLSEDAHRALESASPILILGETGSGKGVLANWLHRHGTRAREPFVDINCAGLSRDLLESELFGHERGAFTGAVAAKPGLLEVAHRGTLFLDELGDTDLVVQAKLLKTIDDRRFRRLGAVRDRSADVRILAATHRDLPEMVRAQKFRADLYYRLSVLVLRVPPLRERPEDIATLAGQVLGALNVEMGRAPRTLSPEAGRILAGRSWPGNVRELRNVLERAVLRSRDTMLRPEDLAAEDSDPLSSGAPEPAPERAAGGEDSTLLAMERRHIARILEEEAGRVDRAAARLGIGRSTLYQKIKLLDIRHSGD